MIRWTLLPIILSTLGGSLLMAQEPPVVIPGYTTEGRPDFVYVETAENLRWEPFAIADFPSGMMAKTLSHDQARGSTRRSAIGTITKPRGVLTISPSTARAR